MAHPFLKFLVDAIERAKDNCRSEISRDPKTNGGIAAKKCLDILNGEIKIDLPEFDGFYLKSESNRKI